MFSIMEGWSGSSPDLRATLRGGLDALDKARPGLSPFLLFYRSGRAVASIAAGPWSGRLRTRLPLEPLPARISPACRSSQAGCFDQGITK